MKPAGSEIPAAHQLTGICKVAAGLVIAGSGLIFCGWALGVPALTRLLPAMVVMNPTAALLFVLAGAALWCLGKPQISRTARFAAVLPSLGGLVAIIGLLKLVDYATGLKLHVDRLLFPARMATVAGYPSSEMAPNTALNFILCGLALALSRRCNQRSSPLPHLLMLVAGWITLLALVGYTYRVLVLYRLGSEMPMSLDSALGFGILTLGFFASQPDRGFMRLLLSRTTGGAMSRRLLPMAILVPWILGAAVLLAQQVGYLQPESGLSLFVVACILVFTGLIWWNARLLYRGDLERSEAAERLHQLSANLQRSNTELQQFAYVASHDLFEPLRMITSYLQLLNERQSAQLDPQSREFIGFAIDGARRMHALIQDLLAYSRVDLRGNPFEAVDCEQVFQAATTNLKIAIEETGARITHQSLPTVRGDPVQLTQVFQNLIGNAIKFRGPETPRVDLGARRQDQEWVFWVRDNGIGIDPKHFDRLFVIFQRLHTRQEYPGTGIGLAICKKIIERHGGRIWVESAPGAGATLSFTLPVLDPPA